MREFLALNYEIIGLINWLSAAMGFIIYVLVKYQNARATCKKNKAVFSSALFWSDKWPSFMISLLATIICMWGMVESVKLNPITSATIGTAGATIFYNLTQTVIKRVAKTPDD